MSVFPFPVPDPLSSWRPDVLLTFSVLTEGSKNRRPRPLLLCDPALLSGPGLYHYQPRQNLILPEGTASISSHPERSPVGSGYDTELFFLDDVLLFPQAFWRPRSLNTDTGLMISSFFPFRQPSGVCFKRGINVFVRLRKRGIWKNISKRSDKLHENTD